MASLRPHRRPLWVAAALSVAAAGCGGSPTTTPGAIADAPLPTTPVTLEIANTGNLPLYVPDGSLAFTLYRKDGSTIAFEKPCGYCECGTSQCGACAQSSPVDRIDPGDVVDIPWDGREWDAPIIDAGRGSCVEPRATPPQVIKAEATFSPAFSNYEPPPQNGLLGKQLTADASYTHGTDKKVRVQIETPLSGTSSLTAHLGDRAGGHTVSFAYAVVSRRNPTDVNVELNVRSSGTSPVELDLAFPLKTGTQKVVGAALRTAGATYVVDASGGSGTVTIDKMTDAAVSGSFNLSAVPGGGQPALSVTGTFSALVW